MSPCATCTTARCCIVFDPELTGADLHRLCRARGLAPDEVATLAPVRADQAGPDAIVLGDDGCAWEMRLSRTRNVGANGGRRRCQFLVGIAPGQNRCGVYADRPMMCRLYPSDRTPFGIMVGSPRRVCPPGAWHALRADIRGLLTLHDQADAERAVHRRFLASWNALARGAPVNFTRAAFLACTLAFYDARAAAPEADLEALLATSLSAHTLPENQSQALGTRGHAP